MTPQTATAPMLFDSGQHRVGAFRFTGSNGDAIARWAGFMKVCEAFEGSHAGELEIRLDENSSAPLYAKPGDWVVHHHGVGYFPLDARIFVALYRVATDVPEGLQEALTSGGPYPIDRGPRPKITPEDLTTDEREFFHAATALPVGFRAELQGDVGFYKVWRGMDAWLLLIPAVEDQAGPGEWSEMAPQFVEATPTAEWGALRLIDLVRARRLCKPTADWTEFERAR